jgi:NAD(P)-dependent dehydrogenase (short-subunit alcohol dehydrogenase family)
MQNKMVLITGATAGIGRVTALELAKKGAHVVVVGRSIEKIQSVLTEIQNLPGSPQADFLLGDLSLLADVRRIAAEYRQRWNRLDVLVNNAGGIFMKRQITAEGHEMSFALNHLSYFLLTNLLLDMLRNSAPARIVNVSSMAHLGSKLDLKDLENKHLYTGSLAYSRTKLMNVYFTYELARRSGVSANVLHPGYVATNFGTNNGGLIKIIFTIGQKILAVPPEHGARTMVYLASSEQVEGISGKYFDNCKPVRSSAISYNPAVAAALWQASLEICGLSGTENHRLEEPEN